MQFNSIPEVRRRLSGSLAPERQKIYHRSLIQETETGFLFVTINDAGGIHSSPLDRLLGTNDQPLEEILSSTRPIKKAQVAYIIHELLRETEFEELINTSTQNKEEIVKKLKSYGINIPESIKKASDLIEMKFLPPGKLGKIRTLLAPLIVYASVYQGLSYLEDPQKYNEIINPTAIERTIREQNIQFPDSLPEVGLDWKIEGTMPSDGYFITQTSHIFKGRHWEENEEIKRPLKLPQTIDIQPDDPYLTLSKIIPVNWLGDTTFKIPIKENTKVTAIQILDKKGEYVGFETYELTDGTVQVKIPNRLSNPAWITLNAKLSPQPQNTVRAPQHLHPVNSQKLSEKTNNILKNATEQSPSNPSKTIFDQIRQNHGYSLDPPNKEKLKEARTPEEVLNTIIELEACMCEVCNTAAVLASSTQEKAEAVNMAYGYIGISNHPAGASVNGFLRSEAAHAFGIDEKGEILDATPTGSTAADSLTQEYIKILRNPPGNADATWSQQQQEMINQANQKKNLTDKIKLLGGIAAAAAGGLGLYQGIRVLRRPETKERVRSLSDTAITTIYSTDDLQRAHNFFEWLSYGKKASSSLSNRKIEFSNKKEA
ncbi:MAG: hypothetical protein AAB583_05865, partial [Patescibacteria group bacterium]